MRKSLIITVVIALLCLCGCEAVVTVPESPELTRASEMLLTTTAAEESTDKLEATTTSSLKSFFFGIRHRLLSKLDTDNKVTFLAVYESNEFFHCKFLLHNCLLSGLFLRIIYKGRFCNDTIKSLVWCISCKGEFS